MKSTAPWLLVLVALVALTGVRPGAKPGAETKGQTEDEEQAAAETEAISLRRVSPESWCRPAELLAEFSATPFACGDSEALAALAAASLRTDFYIALVPDPIDTPLPALFDQAIAALQEGFAQSGYLFDRFWLPWLEEEAKEEKLYRESPGILLFRHRSDGLRLAAVLVVGETPKAGLHRKAMGGALAMIGGMGWTGTGPQVGVFGPTFSGTAQSLQAVLKDRPSWRFRVATGSATAEGLEKGFEDTGADFCRTVLPDPVTVKAALGFLERRMGWNLSRMALLREADTAYGMLLGDGRIEGVSLPFPSHLSDLRNVRRGDAEKPSAEDKALDNLWKPSRPVMDLNLIDRERTAPVDRVPAFSSLTPVADDLALSNILETLSREEFRYVGVLATDAKDKLFLAEEIRRYAPGAILFSLDNNLLYAHPKLSAATDGMIVISSYPLFTEGAPWLPSSTSSERSKVRRQYVSDFEQGLVAAVRHLLGAGVEGRPAAWVAAVSNGSIWPLARLPVEPDKSAFAFCGAGNGGSRDAATSREDRVSRSWAGKVDFQLLFFALLVVVLAHWLKKSTLINDIEGISPRLTDNNRWLLILGLITLTLAASILLVLATVPILFATDFFTRSSLTNFDLWRWGFFMAGFFVVYAWLVRTTVRVAPSKRGRDSLFEWLRWIAIAVAVQVVVGYLLYRGWVPAGRDGLAYAYLRVLTFSSGLSPVLSLGLLVGGGYAWLLNEMKRRMLVARQAVCCPFDELDEPVLAGADALVREIAQWTDTTLPAKGWMLWLLPVILFLPPALLLWTAVQPIAESLGYGRYFLTLLIAIASLTALSFFRFWALWRHTQRLLKRLDLASPELQKAFTRLAPDLEWRPMKSFGLRLPPFRGLVLSVRKLEELARRVRVKVEEDETAFDTPLSEILRVAGRDDLEAEIANRQRLEELLERGLKALAPMAKVAEVREVLALRVAVYLRYVFSHMRSALLGAVVSGLLALVAVHSYQFEPKQFISLALWILFSLAVLAVLWVFFSMDRNPTLSRIGGTTPGAVTFDSAFVTNLLTYAAVPILGLVGTQVSAVGNVLGPVLEEVLRVLGGG